MTTVLNAALPIFALILLGYGMAWRRVWSEVIPFYAFPKDVRRLIYTTDDIDKQNVNFPAIIAKHGRPRDEERRRDASAAALSFTIASHLWRPCTF